MKVAPASIIKPPWNSLTELMALSTKGFLGDGDVNPAVHSHQHLCLLSVFFLILCGFHCKDDNVWIKFLLFFFCFFLTTVISQQTLPGKDRSISKVLCASINSGLVSQCQFYRWISLSDDQLSIVYVFGLPVN